MHTQKHREWLRQRAIRRNRENNPAPRRPCITPLGKFDSLTLAAKAHGVSKQAVQQIIRRKAEGWEYV